MQKRKDGTTHAYGAALPHQLGRTRKGREHPYRSPHFTGKSAEVYGDVPVVQAGNNQHSRGAVVVRATAAVIIARLVRAIIRVTHQFHVGRRAQRDLDGSPCRLLTEIKPQVFHGESIPFHPSYWNSSPHP